MGNNKNILSHDKILYKNSFYAMILLLISFFILMFPFKYNLYLKDNYFYINNLSINKYENKFDFKNVIFDITKDKYYKNDQFHILEINNILNLNVVNNDPIIILNNIKTDSKDIILSYEIKSNIDTIFQVFYKKESSLKYDERNSYKVLLKKGNNEINLLIPSEYVNNSLRVDLVSNTGNYEIKKFKIFETE